MPDVLPLRAIALQALFLWIAIAIEAKVFHRRLQMEPKQSIQYAACLNLLATIVGWLAFFIFLGSLSVASLEVKAALLNFIFFDQLARGSGQLILFMAFATFLATLGIKWLGLVGLDRLLDIERVLPTEADLEPESAIDPPKHLKNKSVFRERRRVTKRRLRPKLEAILAASAQSYAAIFLILLYRFASALFQAQG